MIPALTFVARHLLFIICAMVVGCILWTFSYVVLLAAAVIGNQGLGGPLSFPAGILAVVSSFIFLGGGIFAPACAIGSICCAMLKLPRLAAIPFVCAAALLLSYLLYWAYIEQVTTHPMPSAWIVLKNSALFLSAPLGIYWWLTEGPGALFDAFRRWFRVRRSAIF